MQFKFCQHFSLSILRSTILQNGFSSELASRSQALAECKKDLEVLYAEKLGPDDLKSKPELVTRVESALRKCDAALTSYTGTMKSIKLAIDFYQHIYIFKIS